MSMTNLNQTMSDKFKQKIVPDKFKQKECPRLNKQKNVPDKFKQKMSMIRDNYVQKMTILLK